MPSRLRYETSPEAAQEIHTISRRSPSPPQKKQKMSLSQTYFVAASARTKLGKEACRPDHNLRLLVGHANLLDSLMVELHDAEREQEAWFNTTVQKAAKAEEPRHIQWMDQIEEDEEMEDAEEAESDSEDEDEDEQAFTIPALPRRIRHAPVSVSTEEIEDSDEEFDDEDDFEHALVRTVSGTSAQSPPELVEDAESDDESPPASPPSSIVEFSEQQRQAIATTAFFDTKMVAEEVDIVDSNYLLQSQNHAPLIAVC